MLGRTIATQHKTPNKAACRNTGWNRSGLTQPSFLMSFGPALTYVGRADSDPLPLSAHYSAASRLAY